MTSASEQFLTDKAKILDWLDTYCIRSGDLTISNDGLVSVTGDIRFKSLAEKTVTHFAVRFDHVGGDFSCSDFKLLTSLVGAPRIVGGNVYCYSCPQLLTLDGLGHTGRRLVCDATIIPSAETVRNLLLHRTELDIGRLREWISIVNDYHQSGDILLAIARFEKYFNEPFNATKGVAALITEFPGL